MVEQPRPDPETQVGALAEVLAAHGVRYVVFGSIAGRLHGAELRTLDIDIVPDPSSDNLARLADALNSLRPRWRTAETGEGMKIDGRLEARHFAGDTFAIGLITRLGYVDVVLHPKGFEAGYDALAPRAVVMRVSDSDIFVGDLEDLIRSKEQLNREKDRLHLPSLRRRAAEISTNHSPSGHRRSTGTSVRTSECERRPCSGRSRPVAAARRCPIGSSISTGSPSRPPSPVRATRRDDDAAFPSV